MILGDVERQFPLTVLISLLGLVHVKSIPCQLVLLTVVVCKNEPDRIFQIKRLSIRKALLRQVDRQVLIAFLDFLELNTRLSVIGEFRRSMQETLHTLAISFSKVFMFPDIGIGIMLVLVPLVHKLVGFLRIFVDLFTVEIIFGKQVVSGGFGFAKFGLEQDAVAVAVPGEEAGLVHCCHLINFIYIVYVYDVFNFIFVHLYRCIFSRK